MNQATALMKWRSMFADPMVRRDQVEATNEHGEPIGKVACPFESVYCLGFAGV